MITLKPAHQKMANVTLGSRIKLQLLQSNQSGFTIIESLMAMVVVTVLLVGITPVIISSVATRVQSRRIDLGTQAARSYIDGVRSGAIAAPPINRTTTTLNSVATPIPNGTLTCSANAYCSAPTATTSSNLYCIDGDGDGACTTGSLKDMVVQAFGYNGSSTTTFPTVTADDGYSLGVRVYRSDAFKDSLGLQNTSAGRSRTWGIGQRKVPVIEITTEMTTANTKFKNFCNRISGSTC
jgi:prepilin-type N-terminal cleavage/methylation domain-containing protein